MMSKIILGIDPGTKRIGLAVSDGLGLTAQGLPTLERTAVEEDLSHIADIVADRGVTEIVLGKPLNLDGKKGDAAAVSEEFAELLRERLGLPVCLWDERLTTAQAERTMVEANVSRRRRKKARDRIAAQLILQSFLDAHREDDDGEGA